MKGVTVLAVTLASFQGLVSDAAGVSSKLQFLLPKELRRPDGYDHREALFGNPPYGGAIQQNVYYADSVLCDADYNGGDVSRGGYPKREVDASGKMKPWKAPFILMVDRGSCSFVEKARNAQRLGAAGVLIADNVCLCSAEDKCVPEEGVETCESQEPLMADDGHGEDVSVPSFLLFKHDADPIKEVLKQDKMVRAEMSWHLPAPDARVEYELWTAPKEPVSAPLKDSFREVAVALGSNAIFTPHYYIYDGLSAGCRGMNGENQCYNLCTNDGRYCSSDPDNDLDNGISGAMVVAESLRQICIWQINGGDGVGLPWWNYVEEFAFRCDKDGDDGKFFDNEKCIRDVMQRSGVDYGKVQECMDEAGGLEGDVENKILEQEIFNQKSVGLLVVPSSFVNGVALRGAMTTGEVFRGICAGFLSGSEPKVCKSCSGCSNVNKCVEVGYCEGVVPNAVSLPVFAASILFIIVCFSIGSYVQWRRLQNLRGIMAEYMPLDQNQKVETVGIQEESSFEDGHVELS